jgi:8-oxo-dGTP pyrophosphatase MutT (NUDIX family)
MSATRWTPRCTVAAVIAHEQRYLVVEERIGGRLLINQPAGHLEPNESLLAAVCREALEETAWEIKPTALLALSLYRAADGTVFQRVTFLADPVKHYPERPLDRPVERALWMSRAELQSNSARLRSPLVMAVIERHERGTRFPLDLLLDL